MIGIRGFLVSRRGSLRAIRDYSTRVTMLAVVNNNIQTKRIMALGQSQRAGFVGQ
jgi:hypothetical protein